jgi:thiosulfate/3-mercaptopyruvate sulfurtransferase
MLVDPAWVDARLGDPRVVLVDMRWREDGSGPARYARSHIPTARYLDWTTDIVEPGAPYAFTLAGPERFAAAMEARGIGDDTEVVAYADRRNSGPFRLWWAFRVYGHDDAVRILDGGVDAWIRAGFALTSDPPPDPPPATWTPRTGGDRVATASDVEAAPEAGVAVLDARPPEQFAGEAVWFETGQIAADPDGIARTPRGELQAGRVPWASNVPWFDLYRADGRMRSVRDLRARFAEDGVKPGSKAIAYCGVGISAAALTYALERAGVEARLYDDSWDEWGRSDRPIERG